ncbi:MAG: hypothetical protein Q9157_002642 [Trypethelium eluteriae]
MAHKRPRASFEADLQAQESPYAFYGTPLPPLDADARDDGSYVPVWKQEVTDERGRKRLHGAFTGGFSAGYFNTVGSKEGWTPSTFVSSRTNRHKDTQTQSRARAEDFMDEEDLADVAEAQKLQTQGAFAGLGSTEDDGLRRDTLIDLLRPGGETMGRKLLQRMGWRPGQGVGPKVRRATRFDEVKAETDAKEDAHLFAPEDSPMISFVRKTDNKGLGYRGEGGLASVDHKEDLKDEEDDAELLAASRKRFDTKKDNGHRTGLGVGILNDTGSDEEDPYELGPKLSLNRTVGGDKKKGKKSSSVKVSSRSFANPSLRNKPVFISKSKASAKGFRKCHDGRLPLNGFLLAITTTLTETGKKYQPPEIPSVWKSSKQPSSPNSTSTPYQSTADAAKASTLDPKSRAALLGETQLPGKSVFDFLSSEARDRLVSASGRSNLPAAGNELPPSGSTSKQPGSDANAIPDLDKEIALAALGRGIGGWMPYSEDLDKRARYRAFMEYRGGLNSDVSTLKRTPGHTRSEWLRELAEFAHAARVFKPMKGLMASRFTSSSTGPQGASDREHERGDATSSGREGESLLRKASEKSQDPAEEAAKMGMFGPMTRTEFRFFPTRLVCKRFNVQPPVHVMVDSGAAPGDNGQSERNKNKLEVVGKTAMNEMMMEAVAMDSDRLREAKAAEGDITKEQEVPERAAVDVEKNEALEGERPGDAVFKAIFGSDDEDE